MFLVWGSKWNYKLKGFGLRVEKICPECDKNGIFFEVIPTKYFTLFWIPIAPTKKKKSLLECPHCHERFYIQTYDYMNAINSFPKINQKENNVIKMGFKKNDKLFTFFICQQCEQKLRIPDNQKLLKITCPSCKNIFHFQNGKKIT